MEKARAKDDVVFRGSKSKVARKQGTNKKEKYCCILRAFHFCGCTMSGRGKTFLSFHLLAPSRLLHLYQLWDGTFSRKRVADISQELLA